LCVRRFALGCAAVSMTSWLLTSSTEKNSSKLARLATRSDPTRSEPSLKGVVGRKSAALEDFRYSNPMKRANLVWDEENLRA
jgi:hypothetical protein